MGDEYTMDTTRGGDILGYSSEPVESFLGGSVEWLKETSGLALGGLIVVIVLLVLFSCWVCGIFNKEDGMIGVIRDGSASGVQYYGEFSGANQGSGNPLAQDAWEIRNNELGGVDRFEGMSLPGPENMINRLPGSRESFIGSRETPYFSDVTNRVLRLENREKEAIRALAKINQEKLRRQAERPDATVPWNSHWNEWKRSNPLGEEQLI